MNRPTLYLFLGYPGAGKTTIAKIIEEASGAVHIWTDHERHDMFNQPTHGKDENNQLYESLNDRTGKLLGSGKSVLFDTNFNYRKDRDYLRSIATSHQAACLIIWLTTPLEVARDRATHDTHRDRNRYHKTMTLATFNNLVDHLETPGSDELFIKIDGTNVDKADLLAKIQIAYRD